MKVFTLIAIGLLIGTLAFADEKADFNEHKQHALKEMSEQIAALQTAKTCIAAATDHDGLRHCHEALEKTRKHKKLEEIDERIHRLQEEKSHLDKEEPRGPQ